MKNLALLLLSFAIVTGLSVVNATASANAGKIEAKILAGSVVNSHQNELITSLRERDDNGGPVIRDPGSHRIDQPLQPVDRRIEFPAKIRTARQGARIIAKPTRISVMLSPASPR